MSFQAPWLLLALLAVPLALAALALARRRPDRYVVRFPATATLGAVLPRAGRVRRALPTLLLCLALAALALALARPEATVAVPNERASVILVTDTSGSMNATDVEPSRLAAAKAAGERAAHLLVVGGRRLQHLRDVAERDRADAQLLRRLLEEALRRRAGGAQPVGPDVGGRHRSRRVGDEHDRGLLDRHRDGRLRAGEREHERGDGHAEQRRRDMAAAARAGRQRGDARAREADGEAAAAPLGEQVERQVGGHRQQAEQEERRSEAHRRRLRSRPRPSSRSQS